MASTVSARVQKHRESLRAAGMRPIQIWVPDTRSDDFMNACRAQSLLVSATESNDASLDGLLEASVAEIDGWAE